MIVLLHWLIAAGAAALLVLSLVPFVRFRHPLIDLSSHFVLQYWIGAVVLLDLAYLFSVPGGVIYVLTLAFLFFTLHLWPHVPLRLKALPEIAGAPVKLLQVNVLRLNQNPRDLENLIRMEKPDIVLIAEVNTAFAKMAEAFLEDYPHQIVEPQAYTSYGMAVLSKIPLEDVERRYVTDRKIPSLFFKVDLSGEKVDVVSIHPATPTYDMQGRDDDFRQIENWYREKFPKHLIVAGDFNATPYCRVYRDFSSALRLVNARAGRGIYGTFPRWLPFFLRIPIDHVLVSRSLAVLDFKLGANVGSDHIPTVTVLARRA